MQVSQKQSVDIDFRNITYVLRAKGNNTILKGVNGQFRRGSLVGILGPSGAGKTTLLNILAGYINNANVTGRINVNGEERDMRKFKKISCYIMQEDVLQKQLSVAEIMMLAANLKLGRFFTASEKRKIVRTVVQTIGLDQCLNTRTENLSGGQLKRVAIALELINNPPVMFLDEPTTVLKETQIWNIEEKDGIKTEMNKYTTPQRNKGVMLWLCLIIQADSFSTLTMGISLIIGDSGGLDNVVAKQCIQLLRTLSDQGRTIICTIHQPADSLLCYFDQVYIMANGYCVYDGSVPKMVPFLDNINFSCPTNYNPIEYIIELVNMNPKVIQTLSTASKNGITEASHNIIEVKQAHCTRRQTTYENLFSKKDDEWGDFPNPYHVQVAILSRRMFVQMGRNKLLLSIQLFHHVVSSLSLGLSFFGIGDNASQTFANFKFLLAVIVFYCYTYIISPILLFPFEIELIRREYFNRWFSLKAYYTALTISTMPPMILFSVIFNTIIYTLTDQPIDATRFFLFNLLCILGALNSYGLGITIGTIFRATTGTCVGSAIGIYLLLMCMYGMGYGENVPVLVKALMLSTFPRHTFNGICTALLRGRPLMKCEDELFCFIRDPEELLQLMGMGDANLGVTIVVLVTLLIIHRAAAYAALKWRLSTGLTGLWADL